MMLSIFTVSPMLPMKPITQPVPACTSGIILILHLLKTSIDLSEYEEEYYPVKQPSLVDMLKLRMYELYELELTQNKLSELLGVCPSRISDYLSGRAEPTLKVARKMSKKLNIDASIVQGV